MPDDAMTDDQLRHWAEHNQSHSAAARGVLRLLAELDASRGQVSGHCERIAAQSELLSRRAEGKFDGSTGTPPHGVAGHKSESAQ